MKKELIYELITCLFVLLFLYTGFSKLLDFKNFEISMRFQHLPDWLTSLIIFTLPAVEIIVGALMIPGRSRIKGICAFLILMTGFTLYVGAAMLDLFPKSPCACGGIIKSMGWGNHFLLNLILTGLAAITLRHYRLQRHSTIKRTAS